MLFAMLSGYLPFGGENYKVIAENICQGEYVLPDNISNEAKDLISKMLKIHPLERISIINIKRHPWYTSKEKVTFALKDYTNKDESQKVNQVVFAKLLNDYKDKVDFKNLSINQIEDSIRTKKNYSFVIGYELLLKDHQDKILQPESHNTQLYFGPVKDYLDH